MSAAELVERARSAGFRFRVDGDRVIVSPWSDLPSNLRDELREHKREVLEFLRSEPPRAGRLCDGGRRWTPDAMEEGLCPCGQEPVGDTNTGLCLTCFATLYGRRATGRPPSYYVDPVERDEEGVPLKKTGKGTRFIPFAPDPRRGGHEVEHHRKESRNGR
jgi:hypothetical protein